MYNVTIKNVRCFSKEHTFSIKPITLLIGENSSGKSTFLASTRIAWDLFQGKQSFDFNEEPFIFGSFDQIATYRGGKAGRAKEFAIGMSADLELTRNGKKELVNVNVRGSFIPVGGKPKLAEWKLVSGKYKITLSFGKDNKSNVNLVTPSGRYKLDGLLGFPFSFGVAELFTYLRFSFREKKPTDVAVNKPTDEELSYINELGFMISYSLGERPYAIAPIRTRPSVTYDPFKDIPTPEGAHIPTLLAKISSTDEKAWKRLRDSLNEFGRESGLFDDVEVRKMGQKQGDPFQVTIKLAGPHFNLAYVGYGVSQILPILVDTLQASENSTFLLQQPEVHLHPKAQAELGSFLSSIAKIKKNIFIIETHSDYLFDRIKMDIRDGKYITADDVSVLYFERRNGVVSVSEIELDKHGDLINVPNNYRKFFLEEERRMLLGE
ncbi:MAG: AAA family ATPase [Chloroflexi bacterium]|nr:AAA family ATPase [Chloroflexota bacterium]